MEQKIYLYVKTSPLGLKYLGKTIKDPFKYRGSGLVWLNHIKKHKVLAKDIITEILFISNNNDEIKEKGLFYSELFNIVESKEWANLKPETGEGGSGKHNDITRKKISDAHKGKVVSDEVKKRMSLGQIGKKISEESKKKMSDSKKKMSDETKNKIVQQQGLTKQKI